MKVTSEGTGERVREARRGAAMTQGELAERAEMSPNAVHKIETGVHSPRPTTVRKLAAALGVEVREITGAAARAQEDAPAPAPRRRLGLPREERIKVGLGQPAADAVSAGRGE